MEVAVIGLGLIGGSLLRALPAAGHRVRGHDADPATRAKARTAAAHAPAGQRWQVPGALGTAVAGAELVIIAVPLPAVTGIFDELGALGYAGLVTDVTSVKSPVLELAGQRLRQPRSRLAGFVGGHPMAGREVAGFANSAADLFAGCAWALCLDPGVTALADWLAVAALVTNLGVRVVPTTAAEHDRAVAAVSHLPHLLAAALATTAAGNPLAGTLAAGSFRDGSRVAASPPELVAAMCAGNAKALGEALDEVLTTLDRARISLRAVDPAAALRPWLAEAATVRAAWPPAAGTTIDLPAEVEALLRLGRAGGWITAADVDRRSVRAVAPASYRPEGFPPAGAAGRIR